MNKEIKNLRTGVLLMFLFYLVVVTTINKFSCPNITETELLFNIPEALILNFKCR